MTSKRKIYIDDKPTKDGNVARGMGMYTSNLIKHIKKNIDKHNLEFSQLNYQLLHIPYFDLYFNTLKNIDFDKKIVITVPDVIPLVYPNHYPAGIRGKVNLFKQKKALKKADAIITISETSKKDIVRLLNIEPDRIHVTYLAPNFEFKKLRNIKNTYNLPKQFVLYVGDVNYNKNLLTLCRAVKKANKKLVIVGKQAVSEDYDHDHIENQPLAALQEIYGEDPDIIRLGFLSNEELNEVWNLATIYCQPSFYEGFGLPVLEAMQAGVPVIASRTQALVEIADKAAMYFNPYDEDELAEKIKLLFNSKKTRNDLVKAGKKQVKQYSWDKMAKEIIEIYKQLL